MRKFALTAIAAAFAVTAFTGGAAKAAGDAPVPEAQDWSWQGLFGTYDRAQLQRGFQVYKNVCAGCHSLRFIAFRNLEGIGFNEEQIKAIAAEYDIEDGPNDDGDMFTRPGIPADYFPSPFPNEKAAAASNGGAVPPDLSLMNKARVNGPDYVFGLLTGYEEEAPEGFDLADGKYYNHYFPGHQIAMAPPLYDEAVEYTDGTPMTLEQHARDVTAFLNWTAQPELEARKALGMKVILFLIVFTAMLYAVKRKIWRDVEH
ncbi:MULTISPECIES: cytochrome c1 [Thalassospira]|jgi:ubiquinol-cytochrome c reductase cytochrome c1 subunit|uniref:Cytochrome c1 n=1 Tax=Thalassospira profundimaris TaxID=502049 RepID=A0A367VM28_9PROT|nr:MULTISPECIES: cytochrome c1 [Thalassospira]MBR9899406.1 cytochrome c1 [Rhodospirillales bacterium]KZB70878.1 cytochrome C [Thalassospira sp. MCCC 1A01148]MBO6805855.1 cytochrome c1 [Thalassospira sp.]MBO6842583.1 cytochrome c1 [Thalassospira sp.]MBS8273493.1 cytochrome c1 [Thalassospira tepidiphila]|tara:strand:- start:1069 stop:1845 length:777 start_codon:yes stop_codon:yes gene_type:complete